MHVVPLLGVYQNYWGNMLMCMKRFFMRFTFLLTAAFGLSSCGGSPLVALEYGRITKYDGFVDVGLQPGCWFGEGGAFQDYSFSGEISERPSTNSESHLRIYEIPSLSNASESIRIGIQEMIIVGKWNAMISVYAAKKGTQPPKLEQIFERVDSDFEKWKKNKEIC